ncbi:hypothetical protein C789_4950 [Microcystis aeruginosa FACHB-905 = DIANCHI905]|uniref:Uncharacterized protein n=2 Tax=Microcystis aeruginosa (strain PCC 7806) TaxID=267872 RepID=A8YEN4_MICA7|nr:hypothetical protein BH695_4999 [Microcystis aeruginosa PCC 7806SL]ELS45238.1 hypothetical protein C789_4950 [Microcystis aeruginosa FACHB-905 = DIANCHI905]CAO89605.1 unnamed protein product [Microcystis aeruginosa PCC 7806]
MSLHLAPHRGLPSQYLSILLVRSYRTFAPLPPISYQVSVISYQLSVESYQWKVISYQ